MARSLFRDTIALRGPAGLIPLSGAAARFYYPDGGALTPIAFPLYPDATSATPLPVPFTTGVKGELEVWSDDPCRVRVIVSKTGYDEADENIGRAPDRATSATTGDIADAITEHEAGAAPHQVYLTQPEGALRYLPLTTWNQPDPLGQYQKESERGQPSGYSPLDPNGL